MKIYELKLELQKQTTCRLQAVEERISDIEDTIEEIDTSVKENGKCKNLWRQTILEI